MDELYTNRDVTGWLRLMAELESEGSRSPAAMPGGFTSAAAGHSLTGHGRPLRVSVSPADPRGADLRATVLRLSRAALAHFLRKYA